MFHIMLNKIQPTFVVRKNLKRIIECSKRTITEHKFQQKLFDTKDLTFYYPKYESPFTVSINPNYSEWMVRYCNQWAIDNSGLMKQFPKHTNAIQNSDLGLYSAVTFPTANWHRIEKLIKWSLVFFICDDYHEISQNPCKEFSVQPFWDQLNDAMDSFLSPNYYTKNHWPDFIKAAQQICREIYFDYSMNQIKRSTDMVKAFVEGNIKEIKLSNNIRDINWDNYLTARLGSVGGQMTLQFIEYSKNIELTDNEWNHELINQLNKCVSEEMILMNDFFTFRKEVEENNFDFLQMKHPFAILVNNEGLTLQQSVDKVYQLIVDKDEEILNLFKTIRNCCELNSRSVELYMEGVSEVLGGYWRHSVTARRYHGRDFVGAIPPEGQFIYDTNQTIIKPKNKNYSPYKWLQPVPFNVQPKL